MPELLAALRGAQLAVRSASGDMMGRIVSVEPYAAQLRGKDATATQHRVALMTSSGIQRFVLEEARSWQFVDPALRAQVDGALASMAANRARDGRTVEIVTKGSERRTVRVAYVTSVPIWKSAYRLTVPAQGGKTGQLQGWAVVENLSGQDWKNVELTLTSGKPVAFAQNLYTSYFNQRPQVPVEMPNRIVPRADLGTVAARQDFARAMAPAPAPAPAPMAARSIAETAAPRSAPAPAPAAAFAAPAPIANFAQASESAVAQDQDTQMSYRLPLPVTVSSGRSLAVPIIAADLPMERVAQHQTQVSNLYPLAAIQLTNNSANSLPPGAVTLYEGDAKGGTFLGDAQLAVLPAGDNRMLAFALDQKITIASSVNNSNTTTRVGLDRATLLIDNVDKYVHTYNIKSVQQQEQNVVVEVPKYNGYSLSTASGKSLGEAAGLWRVSLPTPANSARSHDVVLERANTTKEPLGNVYIGALPEYIKTAKDDATAAVLRKVLALRQQIEKQSGTTIETNSVINDLRLVQKTLRDNLASVEKSSVLYRRYSDSLNTTEDSMDKALRTRDTAQSERVKAEAELKAYLNSL
jgi:hypothetical protein